MEYTQWGVTFFDGAGRIVLILVVMEYTQWDKEIMEKIILKSLNPCCNGIYSMR